MPIFAKQADFPYIRRFKTKFPITDKTIFVYNRTIYCDYEIPPDIKIHELEHIRQQDKVGAAIWIENYLASDEFRLKQEIAAYKKQIEFIKDRGARNYCRMEAAQNLSSSLYGNLISFADAIKKLS